MPDPNTFAENQVPISEGEASADPYAYAAHPRINIEQMTPGRAHPGEMSMPMAPGGGKGANKLAAAQSGAAQAAEEEAKGFGGGGPGGGPHFEVAADVHPKEVYDLSAEQQSPEVDAATAGEGGGETGADWEKRQFPEDTKTALDDPTNIGEQANVVEDEAGKFETAGRDPEVEDPQAAKQFEERQKKGGDNAAKQEGKKAGKAGGDDQTKKDDGNMLPPGMDDISYHTPNGPKTLSKEDVIALAKRLQSMGVKGISYQDVNGPGPGGATHKYILFDHGVNSLMRQHGITQLWGNPDIQGGPYNVAGFGDVNAKLTPGGQ